MARLDYCVTQCGYVQIICAVAYGKCKVFCVTYRTFHCLHDFFSLYFLHYIVTFTFNILKHNELTEYSTASRHRSTLRLMLPKDSLTALYASLYLLCL